MRVVDDGRNGGRGGWFSVVAGRPAGVLRTALTWSAGATALLAGMGGLGGVSDAGAARAQSVPAQAVPAVAAAPQAAVGHGPGRSLMATAAGGPQAGRVAAAYGRLPLAFEPNRGQTSAEVRYLAHGPGYGVFITPRRTVLALSAPRPGGTDRAGQARHDAAGAALSFRAVGGGGRATDLTAGGRLGGTVNYLKGRDHGRPLTGLPTYHQVTAPGVYRGIDLRWYGTQQGLEYDVAVAPGADPGRARLAIDGLSGPLRLTAGGDLVMPTAIGEVVQRAPRAYQVVDGARRPVPVRFRLAGPGRVGFDVGRHDRGRRLVIDPTVVYSTYLGGAGEEEGRGIAVDSAGNAYLTGPTSSPNFPVTAGAFQPVLAGGLDAFVAKLNPTGTALVYSTYLGGIGNDAGNAIAVDSAGDAYVTGDTNSPNFPVTPGAFQPILAGGLDAFVAKLNPTGTALVYSTYLGGIGNDSGAGIALDFFGDAYVTGSTGSPNFPVTPGSFQPILSGVGDAFATKLNPVGTALIYSTYLGGVGNDSGSGVAVDSAGNVYLTGFTASPNFPVTVGAFQPIPGGASDAFATELNALGTAPVFSTYLGGALTDVGKAIAVDATGTVYVAGFTGSPNYPVTAGAFRTSLSGPQDAFVTRLNATGTALVYSTYLGGAASDAAGGIAVDSSGDAYVTGDTTSPDFPVTAGAFQTVIAGGPEDVFVTRLNATGTALVYSTFLGGTGIDVGRAIALDAASGVYVTGVTGSADFPVTPGAFQTALSGTGDGFATKLDLAPPAPQPQPQPTPVRPRQRRCTRHHRCHIRRPRHVCHRHACVRPHHVVPRIGSWRASGRARRAGSPAAAR